jgi:2-amino-4-hydroxy-6-hydroxymethyldihydropteridine diphosphokinase
MSISTETQVTIAYIGIGANLGNARAQVLHAIDLIGKIAHCTLLKTSSLYGSAPVDAPPGIHSPDFINAVCAVQTSLAPPALLKALHRIESQAGRVRNPHIVRNAPRTLDLDILLYGQSIIRTELLQVPHPRMHRRAFVLLPLMEIAPEVMIPHAGKAASFVASVSDQRVLKLEVSA